MRISVLILSLSLFTMILSGCDIFTSTNSTPLAPSIIQPDGPSIVDRLRSGENFVFPVENISVALKGSSITSFALKNTGTSPAHYCVVFETIPITGGSKLPGYIYDDSILTLDSAQEVIIPLTIDAYAASRGRYNGKVFAIELNPTSSPSDCSSYRPAPGTLFIPSTLIGGELLYGQMSFVITVD